MSKVQQRSIILLKDYADGSFTADLTFEPSVKDRKDATPGMRAAWRIANAIVEQKEKLIAPMAGVATAASERPSVIITDAEPFR